MRSGTGGEFLRTVLPPLIGGLMMLAFAAMPVFTGNAFRYRNAFALEVISQTTRDGISEAGNPDTVAAMIFAPVKKSQ